MSVPLLRRVTDKVLKVCHKSTGVGEEKNVSAFVAAAKQCSKTRDLEAGKKLHLDAVAAKRDRDKYVAAALITMYSKCGCMALAREVFNGVLFRDVVTWNCLILGYVENGESTVALELFHSMDGCAPTHVTYLAALKACAGLASQLDSDRQMVLDEGMSIQEQVAEHGLDYNVAVATALVDVYSKCGSTRLAREAFQRMTNKSVVTWNCLILGYVDNGHSSLALDAFASMDCEPNHVTYLGVLKACAGLADDRGLDRQMLLRKGMALHEQVKKHGFQSNILVATSLVDMYSKIGNMQQARNVFEGMARKDVVAWNSLMSGYVENDGSSVALDLLDRMDCEPSYVTYLIALKACSCLATQREAERHSFLDKGKVIHKQLKERAFDSHLVISNALVAMYSKCGDMALAMEVFERMTRKDAASWTSLILGYVENEESSVALELFTRMDCEPDILTYPAVLRACAILTALPAGRVIHGRVCKLGLEEDTAIASALVDLYGRCGCTTNAVEVFATIHSPNIVSWTALVAGYSSLGDTLQVFSLVKDIQEAGLRMDAITFVSILTACSHAGMVEEGEMLFESMHKYGIRPTLEHYNCMIGMLGRANRIAEAFALVDSMPFNADKVSWMTLLLACKKWNNVQVGKVAFDALVASDRKSAAAAYVIMRDIYGSLRMWQDWERMDAQLEIHEARVS